MEMFREFCNKNECKNCKIRCLCEYTGINKDNRDINNVPTTIYNEICTVIEMEEMEKVDLGFDKEGEELEINNIVKIESTFVKEYDRTTARFLKLKNWELGTTSDEEERKEALYIIKGFCKKEDIVYIGAQSLETGKSYIVDTYGVIKNRYQ